MKKRENLPITRRLLFLATLLLAVIGASAGRAQIIMKTVVYQGDTRTWFEHVPASYNGSRPVPLVLALHGFNNSGDQFAVDSEWMPKADRAGFIVVFPNGGGPVDKNFCWHAWSYDGKAPDDVGFLLALIEQLKKDYRIDPARVYMTGFSNGGGMTSTFAELHADVLAGIALASGGWVPSPGMPRPDVPLPVWLWRGTAEDAEKGNDIALMDQRQTAFWTECDGSKGEPQVYRQGAFTTTIYRGGKAEVRFTSIEGADHAYHPGTAEKIWDGFFSIFSRQGTNIVYHAPK